MSPGLPYSVNTAGPSSAQVLHRTLHTMHRFCKKCFIFVVSSADEHVSCAEDPNNHAVVCSGVWWCRQRPNSLSDRYSPSLQGASYFRGSAVRRANARVM